MNRNTYLQWLKDEEEVEGDSRFEKLYSFLKEERRRMEKLVRRANKSLPKEKEKEKEKPNNKVERCMYGDSRSDQSRASWNNCLIHLEAKHYTRKCNAFKAKSMAGKVDIMKKTKGCHFCLSIEHIGKPSPKIQQWGVCGLEGCDKYHSRLLHEAEKEGLLTNLPGKQVVEKQLVAKASANLCTGTLLLVQTISTEGDGEILCFFDNGSTVSLVSKDFVRRHGLKGIPVSYDLITVGGTSVPQTTYLHIIRLKDFEGKIHDVTAFQIDDICGTLQNFDTSIAARSFAGLSELDVRRPTGSVDLLISMRQAAIHPTRLDVV